MTVTTLNIPPGIPSDGMVRADFVPDGGFADPNVPTVTEVLAASAQDLSCHLSSFGEGVTENRREETRLCLKQAFETFGAPKFTVENLEYVYDVQNPESLTHEAYAALAPTTFGFLVLRWGKEAGEEPAAGDIVDVVRVQLGQQSKGSPATNASLTVTQEVAVQYKLIDLELAAGV